MNSPPGGRGGLAPLSVPVLAEGKPKAAASTGTSGQFRPRLRTIPHSPEAVHACLVAVVLLAGPTRAEPRRAVATPAETGIVIDGALDEAAWAGAKWASGFFDATATAEKAEAPRPAPVSTRFKVLLRRDSLFVGAECEEPLIEKLQANTPWRHGAVWQDDCIEIFFDPSGKGRYYHEVMVNARGAIYDSYSADFGLVHSKLWNGAFRAAGRIDREAKKWSVEVEIPFGAIVLNSDAGAVWLWNVARERHAAGTLQLSSWSPLKGNFHQPRLFGTLAGLPADYSPYRVLLKDLKVDVARTGSGVSTLGMQLKVKNETGQARRARVRAAVFEKENDGVQSEPLDLPAEASVAVVLPPLTFRGSAPKKHLVFSVIEMETGRLLRAEVRNVATEYHPIALQVLRPCYRNNIYPDESVKEIVFRAKLSAQVRPQTRNVRYALVNDSGGTVASGSVPASKTGSPLRLPVPSLAIGKYRLEVKAEAREGRPVAEAAVAICKLPRPAEGSVVRIDENRNLLVDGKPLFAIGWYGGIPKEDRPEVMALQNVSTPLVPIPPGPEGIVKNFQNGVYSVVSVENGRLFYSFKLWQRDKAEVGKAVKEELHTAKAPSETVKRLAREMIEKVRDAPGLLGYYIADEPEIHNVPSAYLENYYQFLRAADPYHPVFVTNDTLDGIVTHGYKCADVLNPDPYSSNWDYVPNFLKRVNEVAGPGQTWYVTLWHSARQTHMTAEMGEGPPYSYRVFRNQYFASIAYGAKGFTAYTSAFFRPEIEYRYGLPYVWKELRFLEKAILSPARKQRVEIAGGAGLAVWARECAGRHYLLLVHHRPGTRDVQVRWEPFKSARELFVLSEGRTVKVRSGQFADHFEQGDVHIYTDDARAGAFPTLRSIRAELDRRNKESIRPGNLLHWTRGTRARCSKGYFAPWFVQYYYYAINGLRDDKGWAGYWQKDKTAWLELALKRPAEIGQVRIFTPNLKDYTLEFTAPDGTKRRATVKGNDSNEIVHNFRPPVDCLKLRVTATAVREEAAPGARGPLVSEIEAYTAPGKGPLTPVADVAAAPSTSPAPLFNAPAKKPFLWMDDFSNFEVAPKYEWKGKDTRWVLNADEFEARPRPGEGITVRSRSPRGYSRMTHIFPYRPDYRFFQAKLSGLEGKGYRFTYIGFGTSSGARGYRRSINTSRPGIYTVDTYAIHPNYRAGKEKSCFITISCAGARKNPDGSVSPGPRFTFDWVRLAARPANGLAVTLGDGSPLGASVKQGDTLHFELHLEKPAQDAVVEAFVDSSYRPLAINGEPYVQLRRANGEGKVWTAEAVLGPGTGKFKPKGYPVVFRAGITGGALSETWASAFVEFR